MRVIPTQLEDILVIEPDLFSDSRGFFLETYNADRYRSYGIDRHFVQDNMSLSVKNTLRGLHFQVSRPQAKLVQVIRGEIFDVAVDVRASSPTFGRWAGVYLSDTNRHQIFIPEGFAHGFCVLSETAIFSYKCSDFYDPADEGGVLWSDPQMAIDWPVKNPTLSNKDLNYPHLSDLTVEQLPKQIR
jgi:dTDP-4-dehydrorhamnose 3,5-epimerase